MTDLAKALRLIEEMTRFHMENPDWVKRAEEAREWCRSVKPLAAVVPKLYEIPYGSHHSEVIQISYRGSDNWVVIQFGEVLNRDEQWEYEPLPSNRTDEFIARTRFPLIEAISLAQKHAKILKLLLEDVSRRTSKC